MDETFEYICQITTHVLMLLCLPLNVLLMRTLMGIRQSHFIVLLLSVTLSDTIACAIVPTLQLILNYALQFHIHFPRFFVLQMYCRLFFAHSTYMGAFVIAVNRFMFIIFPSTAAEYWGNRATTLCVAAQWLTAFATSSPVLHPDLQGKYINGSAHNFIMYNWKVAMRLMVFNTTLTTIVGITILLLYLACALRMLFCSPVAIPQQQSHSPSAQQTEGESSQSEDVQPERKLAVQGICLCVSLLLQSLTLKLQYIIQYNPAALHLINVLIRGVPYYDNPFVLFVLSRQLRNQAKIILNQCQCVISRSQQGGHQHHNQGINQHGRQQEPQLGPEKKPPYMTGRELKALMLSPPRGQQPGPSGIENDVQVKVKLTGLKAAWMSESSS